MSGSAPTIAHGPVLADVLPGTRSRDLILVVLGAGLTCACAQVSIHVPSSPVPITGQTFAVIVAGASLGGARGGASQLLYLLLGLVLPVYAGSAEGWHVISGPTGGYLIAFPIAACVVGLLAERGSDRHLVSAFVAYVAGQLIIFGIGVPWLKASVGLPWSLAIHDGFTIFIVGGLIKATAGGIASPIAWRGVRRRVDRSRPGSRPT